MHTYARTNLQTIPAREQRSPRYTLDERLAAMDRSLAELKDAGLEWSGGYRELQQMRDALAREG